MNKKFLISLLVAMLLLCGSICFATDAGSEIQDSAQKSRTTLDNMGDGIRNVAQDVGNGIQGAASDIGNGIRDVFDDNSQNGTQNDNQGRQSTASMGNGDGGYTATRTNASVSGNGMASTAWVWLILGILGVAIVALTWYYVTQDSSRKR